MTILVLSLVVPAITGPDASATLQADVLGFFQIFLPILLRLFFVQLS